MVLLGRLASRRPGTGTRCGTGRCRRCRARRQMVDLVRELDVAQQLNPHAVQRLGRQIAQGLQLDRQRCAALRPRAGSGRSSLRPGCRITTPWSPSMITRSPPETSVRNGPMPTTAGISMPCGHDRRVAARPADLGDEAADEAAVEVGRLAGRQVVGQHEDGRGQLRRSPRGAGPAGCAAGAFRCRRCRWPARRGSCSRAPRKTLA